MLLYWLLNSNKVLNSTDKGMDASLSQLTTEPLGLESSQLYLQHQSIFNPSSQKDSG